MKRSRKMLAVVLIIVGLVISAFVYRHLYTAPPVHGVVLDASTNKPLVNAVLVAVWYSQSPGFHSSRDQLFDAQEVKTDQEGRFTIPGWKMKYLTRVFGSISSDEPQIIVYKYGYVPKKLQNFPRASRRHSFAIEWHQESKIKLELSVGTMDEKRYTFESGIFAARIFFNCMGMRNKYLLAEFDKFYEEQETYAALETGAKQEPWFQHYKASEQGGCESLYEYLKSVRDSRSNDNKSEN